MIELGQVAYDAFCLAYGLDPVPWVDCPEETREGWRAAAYAVDTVVGGNLPIADRPSEHQ